MEDLSLSLEEINSFVEWVELSGADTIEFFVDENNMPSASYDGFQLSYSDWSILESASATIH